MTNEMPFETQTEKYQDALRALATPLYERAVVIKAQYKKALQTSKEELQNAGQAVPFCVLILQVRLRGNRLEFSWRRSERRAGRQVRSVPCKRTNILRHTNDMDHGHVQKAEKQLAKLRSIWESAQEIRRATGHLMQRSKQAGVGVIVNPADRLPEEISVDTAASASTR